MDNTEELRVALDRAWEAIDAEDNNGEKRETVPVGLKWLLRVNEAVARLRAILSNLNFNTKQGELHFYLDGKLSSIYTLEIDEPFWTGASPKTRLHIRRAAVDDEEDYTTFTALREDLARDVHDTKHDRFAQSRFAWYYEQLGKLLTAPEAKEAAEEKPPQVVRIHEYVMQDLLEYSTSMPTGEFAGKRWKRKIAGGGWMLGEYIDGGVEDGTLLIRWTPIEVIPKKKPPAEKTP